jgi:hypothetical protein
MRFLVTRGFLQALQIPQLTSRLGWAGAQDVLNMERRGAERSQSVPGPRTVRPPVSLTQVSQVRGSIPDFCLHILIFFLMLRQYGEYIWTGFRVLSQSTHSDAFIWSCAIESSCVLLRLLCVRMRL